jgi:hypothetical protein
MKRRKLTPKRAREALRWVLREFADPVAKAVRR